MAAMAAVTAVRNINEGLPVREAAMPPTSTAPAAATANDMSDE